MHLVRLLFIVLLYRGECCADDSREPRGLISVLRGDRSNHTKTTNDIDDMENLKKFGRFWPKKRFKMVTLHYIPWQIKTRLPDGNITWSGLTFDIFNALAASLNFDYELVEPPDGQFGTRRENGSWTGMVGVIVRKEVDLGMSIFAITSERFEALLYFYPFWVEHLSFITKYSEENKLLMYFKPFQRSTWVVLCCTVLVSAGLLSFLGVTHSSVAKITKQTAQEFHLLQAFGAFINQGTPKLPQKPSQRVFLSCYWLLALTIGAVYTGNLVAFLTVQKRVLPIDSLEDLAANPGYQVGVSKGGSNEAFFRNARTKQLQNIWKHNIIVNPANLYSLKDLGQNVARLCREDYVVVGSKTFITHFISTFDDCDLTIASDSFYLMNIGFAAHKGFPYYNAFNQRIQALAEAGLVDRWMKNYFPKQKGRTSSLGRGYAHLDETYGAFLLMGVGLCTACLVLICERMRKFHRVCPSGVCPRGEACQRLCIPSLRAGT